MEPRELVPKSFAGYPPQAQAFATQNLTVFRQMPLSLLPVVLRQVIRYDWCFPAERRRLERQWEALRGMEREKLAMLFSELAALPLSPELRSLDWVNRPQQFTERLTAFLWAQHRIDAYHRAVERYQKDTGAENDAGTPKVARWTIVVVGGALGVPTGEAFEKLAPHGTLFTSIDPADGWTTLLRHTLSRAGEHPEAYGHWYIEGGEVDPTAQNAPGLTTSWYGRVASAAMVEMGLLRGFLKRSAASGQAGPEAASSFLAGLDPDALKGESSPEDAALRHFEFDLRTQGAGCQIFSTTYVQWAARECLHRAQPLTLLARFGPRQESAPMDQLLNRDPLKQPTDPEGSLIDAQMGAFYTWINQSRLPGAEESRFLAWFEGHKAALAIGPMLPRGTQSNSPLKMRELLGAMS